MMASPADNILHPYKLRFANNRSADGFEFTPGNLAIIDFYQSAHAGHRASGANATHPYPRKILRLQNRPC